MRTDNTEQIILILDNTQEYFKAALNIVRNAPDQAHARALMSEYVYKLDSIEKFREEMQLCLPDVDWNAVVEHYETKIAEGVNNDREASELSDFREFKHYYAHHLIHDLVAFYFFLQARAESASPEVAEELRGVCYDLRTKIEKSAFGRNALKKRESTDETT